MKPARSILEKCAAVSFGAIDAGCAADFYRRLNGQVTDLCRSLPKSMQAGAMVFLMEYGRVRVGEALDFFKHYYAPAWSVLYWITAEARAAGTWPDKDTDDALCGQAMAMELHSLDDHLVDGGIPVSHLTLLVRSQAWRRMRDAIDRFCADLPGGRDAANNFIDEYYSGITKQEAPGDLDAYCELFRKQMATWVVMPVLTAMKTGGSEEFVSGLRRGYESFGIAWRLLDDIQDLGDDMADGTRSAVYVCLDDRGRALWDEGGQSRGIDADRRIEAICAMIHNEKVLETVAARIVSELDNAAALAAGIGLTGLAGEYRALAGPVRGFIG
ncbi:MAG TPA: class 1 isoprenoid biosynthesis enzyme [Spirochaetota bacterium]|nr:class 1 isoprenoid biosynthesis enzyme [Spirochaetota bacterium]HPV42621.1 class 1 isoprenoid biosynthesis enzyme [Spirochaetota bacterium]